MNQTELNKLKEIFMPKNLAIIGASNNTSKFGGRFFLTLMQYGYKGKIFPINPKEDNILGLRAWKDIESVPEPIDLAVITVPDKFVTDAVKSCAKKQVKGVEILSAGFKESGDFGAENEKEIADIANKAKMRIVGPNCFGIYCPKGGLTLLPGVDFSKDEGNVGFISQSGGGACDIVNMGQGRGVRFSVLVSYGNGCDIDAVDLLNYFENDADTKVVGAYLEGVRDGSSFFKALKSCAQKKPVIIHKGGLTEQGRRGTLGHTGSMAGSRFIWEAAIKSAGAVAAYDIKDLSDCLMAFKCLDGFKGNSAAVLAGGGLRCVEALDAASEFGFNIPEIDDKAKARIKALLPSSGGAAGNPVDLANPGMPPSVIIPIMEEMAEKEEIDFFVLYQLLFYVLTTFIREAKENKNINKQMFEFHRQIVPATEMLIKKKAKPTVVIIPGIASHPDHIETEKEITYVREYYTSNGIPCFETGNQAFSVLRRVADYYNRRARRLEV